MQCWARFYLPSYIRVASTPECVVWILPLIGLGRRSDSARTEPRHIWVSASFFFFNFSPWFLPTKLTLFYVILYILLYSSSKKIVFQMLYIYLAFVFLCTFNFDPESQREVGLWCTPCSGICPGHCSICGHILTLGWVRFYCKRKYRRN